MINPVIYSEQLCGAGHTVGPKESGNVICLFKTGKQSKVSGSSFLPKCSGSPSSWMSKVEVTA